jgi:hypothetical protein
MSHDHELVVFEEAPVRGKSANVLAWKGYFAAFPRYRISVHRQASQEGQIALLGHTIGSHLQLPDEMEAQISFIWLAEVREGLITRWALRADSPDERRSLGLHV